MPRIEAATVAEHHLMRRGQLVNAAVDVLAEVGADGLTPAAVAKRAGLARSSLYQYYPSTEALLAAAVEAMLQRSVRRVTAALAGQPTPQARVTAYVEAAVRDATSGHGALPGASGVLAPEQRLPTTSRTVVRDLHDQLVQPLRSALAEAGVADPSMDALFVQGVVSAAVSAIGRGAPAGPTADEAVRFALRGVGIAAG